MGTTTVTRDPDQGAGRATGDGVTWTGSDEGWSGGVGWEGMRGGSWVWTVKRTLRRNPPITRQSRKGRER
ncbi:hypothetical protein GCM10026982_31120 [Nocardiopsis aegyptia]